MKKYPLLETERLQLRAIDEQDAKLVLDMFNAPKFLQFVGDRNLSTVEDARQYILDRMLPQYNRLGFGNYVLIRKSDNQKMGMCGLFDREGLETVDIGFGILPEFEGNGFVYEAACKMRDFGFQDLKLAAIQGITDQENKASQHLLSKLGLAYEGLILLPNEEEEIMLYKMDLK